MRTTSLRRLLPVATLALAPLLGTSAAHAAAIVPVTLSNAGNIPANDDGSSDPVALGIGGTNGINFFGSTTTTVYVNNNGNVTFQSAYPTFTPQGLAAGIGQPIIAPFFADVDTRGDGSGLTTYGNATIGGRNAFVVDWQNVGYYNTHTDRTNSFQLILTDCSDRGAGDFDIEYNYDRILWETGDASNGTGGLGGTSVGVGFSNGLSGDANVYFQLPGSQVNGALIDGGSNALIANTLGTSGVLGRYDFQVVGGQVIVPPPPGGGGGNPGGGGGSPAPVPEPMSFVLAGAGLAVVAGVRSRFQRAA